MSTRHVLDSSNNAVIGASKLLSKGLLTLKPLSGETTKDFVVGLLKTRVWPTIILDPAERPDQKTTRFRWYMLLCSLFQFKSQHALTCRV